MQKIIVILKYKRYCDEKFKI